MKLIIISPQLKNIYTVQWIEAHSTSGALIIKPNHAPIILSLIAGSDFSFVLDNNEKKVIHLQRPCFLEVDRESATMLMG